MKADSKEEELLFENIKKMVNHFNKNSAILLNPTANPEDSWKLKISKLTDFEKNVDDFYKQQTINDIQSIENKTKNQKKYYIMFISSQDGKDATVKLTGLLSKANSKGIIQYQDITQSLIHTLLANSNTIQWPTLQLLINFSLIPCTYGYPPWSLRYSEIITVGPLKKNISSISNQLFQAIEKFSKTVQRYGK